MPTRWLQVAQGQLPGSARPRVPDRLSAAGRTQREPAGKRFSVALRVGHVREVGKPPFVFHSSNIGQILPLSEWKGKDILKSHRYEPLIGAWQWILT